MTVAVLRYRGLESGFCDTVNGAAKIPSNLNIDI